MFTVRTMNKVCYLVHHHLVLMYVVPLWYSSLTSSGVGCLCRSLCHPFCAVTGLGLLGCGLDVCKVYCGYYYPDKDNRQIYMVIITDKGVTVYRGYYYPDKDNSTQI